MDRFNSKILFQFFDRYCAIEVHAYMHVQIFVIIIRKAIEKLLIIISISLFSSFQSEHTKPTVFLRIILFGIISFNQDIKLITNSK
jgi:hypothetical protein